MNTKTARRSKQALACAALAIGALSLPGCGASVYGANGDYAVSVGTAYGPYWYPDRYNSFTVVRYPWYGDPPPPPENDPRRVGSITQRAIAEQIHEDFSNRGYKRADSDGDVDVAVYASSEKALNISGYTHDYEWRNLPKLRNKNSYPKGTVIVDVLAPKTHELLWRGETVAPISSDPDKYAADLRGAVTRIVAKYPKAKN
ncbi:MAG: DUF4136 domain-containing protein [Gemmatimonadaceae bacterium]